ncbi:MAG: hypothetical protein WDO24_17030 [Pseudomonadota bacterium]
MLQNKLMHRTGLTTGLAASWLMVLAVTLQGCAPQGGGMAAASTSADDVCRSQRLALDDSQQFFAGDIVKGALIGAAGGALGGFLLGGNGQSAAIGALAGTAAGGFAGYWTSLQNQGGSHSDVISPHGRRHGPRAAAGRQGPGRVQRLDRVPQSLGAPDQRRSAGRHDHARPGDGPDGRRARARRPGRPARPAHQRAARRTHQQLCLCDRAGDRHAVADQRGPHPGTRAERARTGGQARTDPSRRRPPRATARRARAPRPWCRRSRASRNRPQTARSRCRRK